MRAARCSLSLIALALAFAGSGCASPHAYFSDRWADAKDVFTASVGVGGGAKARVGPLNAGIFLNSDRAGLRGGEAFRLADGPLIAGDSDGVLLVFFADQFDLRYPAENPSRGMAAARGVRLTGDALAERHKCHRCAVVPLPSPLGAFMFPDSPGYYTQLEIAAGVGGTLRLGFNPGELLDFLLGWTTLDLFRDDRNARLERDAAEKF
ncbi:MAG TPA: hypothetical protein PK280_10955 [Planctomycetota bacterium]|nr:hypothetical protein [Planctomycetota bacterium]